VHSVGLDLASRIFMIFLTPSGGSSITFSILDSQTPMGSLFCPLIVRLIVDLDFCLHILKGERFEMFFNLICYTCFE